MGWPSHLALPQPNAAVFSPEVLLSLSILLNPRVSLNFQTIGQIFCLAFAQGTFEMALEALIDLSQEKVSSCQRDILLS